MLSSEMFSVHLATETRFYSRVNLTNQDTSNSQSVVEYFYYYRPVQDKIMDLDDDVAGKTIILGNKVWIWNFQWRKTNIFHVE